MRFFVKLLLVAVIIGFMLFSYQIISPNYGIVKFNATAEEQTSAILNLDEIVYYDNDISFLSSSLSGDYIIVIKTTDGNGYLLSATQAELDALSFGGFIFSSLTPKKITTIPYYYFLIAAFVVLILPSGKHKNA